MTTRMNRDDLDVSRPEIVVTDDKLTVNHGVVDHGLSVDTSVAADPVLSSPGQSRGTWLSIAAVIILAFVTAFVVVGVLIGGEDTDVVTQPRAQAPAAGQVAPDSPLELTIEPPARVVAGKAASFVVNYQAGTGQFAGSTEEWGDDVGTSSVSQGACDPAAATTGPLQGRYTVTHTWGKPGTYTIDLGVTSFTCVGSEARTTEASRSLTVQVAAP